MKKLLAAAAFIALVLEPGQRLRLLKLVAYGWSHERTQPAMRDQVAAALMAARTTAATALSHLLSILWPGWQGNRRQYLTSDGSPIRVVKSGWAEFHCSRSSWS